MKIMNLCIKASWIRRWYMNNGVPDYQEVRALKGNKTEPDCINMEEINKEGWQCLGEIMIKWIEYKSAFYKVGKNALAAKVFRNETILEDGRTGTVRVMGRVREQELDLRLRSLNLRDFLGNNYEMKDNNSIDLLLGTRSTFVEFFRLRKEINRLKGSMEIRGKLSRRLKTIFKDTRRGSRALRAEIQNVETREYIENNTQDMQMVRRLVDKGTVLEREIVEIHMGLWGKLFLEPKMID